MLKANTISCCRRLLLSVTLLCAMLLYGQNVVAYSVVLDGAPEASYLLPARGNAKAGLSLQQKEQKASLAAIAPDFTVILQPAVAPQQFHAFAPPTDEELPPFVAAIHWNVFLTRLLSFALHPNAP